MIDRCEKSHQAENLISWPYSSKFSTTTATHRTAMMYQISRHKESTDLAWRWRLPRGQLGSRPPWLVGACLLANLPSKNMLTTTQQRLSTRRDQKWPTMAAMVPQFLRPRIQQSPRMLADCRMRQSRELGTMAAVGRRWLPWSVGYGLASFS